MKCKLIFISLLFFAHASICTAQDFSVRLIDVRNGRPFPNQTVTIQYRKIADGSSVSQLTGEVVSRRFHLYG